MVKRLVRCFFNISIFMFVYSLNWPGDGVCGYFRVMKRLLRTFLPTSILLLIFQKACDLWCELSLITVWVPSY